MKTVALTVAVLALGLAACEDNAPDNAASDINTTELEATADTNAAAADAADASNSADNALDNAANAVENAADDVSNAADNATE